MSNNYMHSGEDLGKQMNLAFASTGEMQQAFDGTVSHNEI